MTLWLVALTLSCYILGELPWVGYSLPPVFSLPNTSGDGVFFTDPNLTRRLGWNISMIQVAPAEMSAAPETGWAINKSCFNAPVY